MSSKLTEGALYFGSFISPKHPGLGLILIFMFIIIIYTLYIRYRKSLSNKINGK